MFKETAANRKKRAPTEQRWRNSGGVKGKFLYDGWSHELDDSWNVVASKHTSEQQSPQVGGSIASGLNVADLQGQQVAETIVQAVEQDKAAIEQAIAEIDNNEGAWPWSKTYGKATFFTLPGQAVYINCWDEEAEAWAFFKVIDGEWSRVNSETWE